MKMHGPRLFRATLTLPIIPSGSRAPIATLIPVCIPRGALQRAYQAISARSMDPDADISKIEPDILSLVSPSPEMLARAASKASARLPSPPSCRPTSLRQHRQRWRVATPPHELRSRT